MNAQIPRNTVRAMLLAITFLSTTLPITKVARSADDTAQRRPNILLAISDDHSYPYTSAYGDKTVNTPAFDRVARDGVLLTNAFAASPGCSPSRAALLTGRHTWQLEQAGTHASSFPTAYAVYPDMLEQAGYRVGYTGKGWGPGNFKISGRARNPAGTAYRSKKMESPDGISNVDYASNFEEFLNDQPKETPFCFWFGGHEPHRRYLQGIGLAAGKKLDDVHVPAFLPDTPEIRSDILDYCIEIEWFDNHLARMLSLLEDRGELENTLIVVTGDNGMPFPRAKANGYEYGIHVPMAISWPRKVPPARVVDDLVGFVDLAPTFLEAAGLKPSKQITGRSLMNILTSEKSGSVDPTRKRVFSARERHSCSRYNNWTYPIRAMRTADFLYIRNFRPERWPAGHPAGFKGASFGYYDIDGCPTKTFLFEHRDSPEYGRYFQLAIAKRPAEELFDIRSDPANLNNLADDPEFEAVRNRLRKEMDDTLRQTGDPRILDGGAVYDAYKRYSHMRTFPPPSSD